jgi:hypothetical protein
MNHEEILLHCEGLPLWQHRPGHHPLEGWPPDPVRDSMDHHQSPKGGYEASRAGTYHPLHRERHELLQRDAAAVGGGLPAGQVACG